MRYTIFDCVHGETINGLISARSAREACRRFIRERAMSTGFYWIERSNVRGCAYIRSSYGTELLITPVKEEIHDRP